MKVYTKTGDSGQTQIYAKQVVRLDKDDAVLDCYGTLDELNAHVGRLLSELTESGYTAHNETLNSIQVCLFQIGFAISDTTALNQQHVAGLEQHIDNMQSRLPAQTQFILPGGHLSASQAHICRTITRRAERVLVALTKQHSVPDVCLRYLNRLSDYFFVVARDINHYFEHPDITLS